MIYRKWGMDREDVADYPTAVNPEQEDRDQALTAKKTAFEYVIEQWLKGYNNGGTLIGLLGVPASGKTEITNAFARQATPGQKWSGKLMDSDWIEKDVTGRQEATEAGLVHGRAWNETNPADKKQSKRFSLMDIAGEDYCEQLGVSQGFFSHMDPDRGWIDFFCLARLVSLCSAFICPIFLPLALPEYRDRVHRARFLLGGEIHRSGNGKDKKKLEYPHNAINYLVASLNAVAKIRLVLDTPSRDFTRNQLIDEAIEFKDKAGPDFLLKNPPPLNDPVFVALTKADLYPVITAESDNWKPGDDDPKMINPLLDNPWDKFREKDPAGLKALHQKASRLKIDWTSAVRHENNEMEPLLEEYPAPGLIGLYNWVTKFSSQEPNWAASSYSYTQGKFWNFFSKLLRV